MIDGFVERPRRNGVDAWIGRRITAELERQKLTVCDLKKVAYLPTDSLEGYRAGRVRFSAHDLMMALRLLGQTPAWLFDGMMPKSEQGGAAGLDQRHGR